MNSPNWQYKYGGHSEMTAHRVYRDNALKIQKEVVTRRRSNGDWLVGEEYFYIDGLDLEFRDEADMMKHLDATVNKKIAVLQRVGKPNE